MGTFSLMLCSRLGITSCRSVRTVPLRKILAAEIPRSPQPDPSSMISYTLPFEFELAAPMEEEEEEEEEKASLILSSFASRYLTASTAASHTMNPVLSTWLDFCSMTT